MKPIFERLIGVAVASAIFCLGHLVCRPPSEPDVAPQGIGNLEQRITESSNSGSDKFALIMTGRNSVPIMRDSIKEASDMLYTQGFPRENVFILDSTGSTNRSYRVDAPASKDAINYLLDRLPRFNGTNGTLVVYYEGHGERTNDLSSLSLPGEDIDQKELGSKLNAINPKQGLLFVDACYSGGFVQEMQPSSNYVAISSTKPNAIGYHFEGTRCLRRFNEGISKNPKMGIQQAYERMLRGLFPTFTVDNKKGWTNFPCTISNTNANWRLD